MEVEQKFYPIQTWLNFHSKSIRFFSAFENVIDLFKQTKHLTLVRSTNLATGKSGKSRKLLTGPQNENDINVICNSRRRSVVECFVISQTTFNFKTRNSNIPEVYYKIDTLTCARVAQYEMSGSLRHSCGTSSGNWFNCCALARIQLYTSSIIDALSLLHFKEACNGSMKIKPKLD